VNFSLRKIFTKFRADSLKAESSLGLKALIINITGSINYETTMEISLLAFSLGKLQQQKSSIMGK
jgi:hypothetical protein